MSPQRMPKAPIMAPMRHGEMASVITAPVWLQWFQQLFDRGIATIPEPPDTENEYILTTRAGMYYWVPSVAPAPAPDVTFGGESATFGGEETKW